jgi:hypothetical protein
MAYKVYISTSSDSQCREYMAVVQRALFSINEFAISAMSAETEGDLPKQHEMAMQLIQQADIFIGLYDSHYGDVEMGETASYLEAEYQFAFQLGLPMLLFVQEEAKEHAEMRQNAFLQHISTNHVLTYFSDNDELAAKVKLAIARYRTIKEAVRKITPSGVMSLRDETSVALPPPPAPTSPISPSAPIAPPSPARTDSTPSSAARSDSTPPQPIMPAGQTVQDWNGVVEQVLAVAGDDIEKIVRRALELHSAQEKVTENQTIESMDGQIKVNPIWGEPLRRSQFASDIFMIMPFREPYNSIYETLIRPMAEELNLTIKRGDDFTSTQGSIIQEVWSALNACRIVIAETSEVNANVYYELGIAHTLGKPVLLMSQVRTIQDLPFDIRHLRFVGYENNEVGHTELKDKLKQSLIWLLNDLAEGGKK